jgi:hypothetical protein
MIRFSSLSQSRRKIPFALLVLLLLPAWLLAQSGAGSIQ